MNLGWPQILVLGLFIYQLGLGTVKHGELKTGSYARHNIWSSLVSASIVFALLLWGGFFDLTTR